MNQITVIGLGAGDLAQMPLGIYKILMNQNQPLFLRTKEHPVIKELEKEGLQYTSYDDVYKNNEEFSNVYEEIVDRLILEAKHNSIVYAVPGHPFVAEETIQRLLIEGEKLDIKIDVIGGQSFLDAMFNALQVDPIEGCQILDGTSFRVDEIQLKNHIIICQVYDAFIASEVKLTLMELLPDDYEVTIVTAAGSKDELIKTVPLFEIDRETTINNLTALYVPPVKDEAILYRDFSKLREVIQTLRGPDGCPWDKKQTHQSLKRYLIEETYEVLDAIDEEDDEHLIEELGDVLLQVMLHAQIGEDEGFFSIDDVIRTLTEKMIRRHPHVFGPESVESAEDVVKTWDEIKATENKERREESILDGIPESMPSLLKAYELQKKAAKVGFDWDTPAPIWMKLQEEIAEFFIEIKNEDPEKLIKEFGDILFVLVNLGRFYKISPEEALHATNKKFKNRFLKIEQVAKRQGKSLKELSLIEMDAIWDEVKKTEM